MKVQIDATTQRLLPRFPVLNTARAIGAIAVLTTHTSYWSGDYVRHGILGNLLARLDVGVAIFFVLSGFLLSRPWLARRDLGVAPPRTRIYFWKRLLRIYPVYVVAVVIALTFVSQPRRLGVGDWLTTLAIGDVYRARTLPAGLTQMWSLSTEVAFYLALPALMALALGRQRATHRPGGRDLLPVRRVLLFLAALVGINALWDLSLSDLVARHTSTVTAIWFPSYLSWFAVGIGLALAHVVWTRPGPTPRALAPLLQLATTPWSCVLLAVGLLVIAATPLAGPVIVAPPNPGQLLFKHVCYAAIGALLVLPGIFGSPLTGYARVMSAPVLQRLGLISYSLFCLHLMVLHLVMRVTGYRLFDGHGWQILLLTLALSIVAAELGYRLVEEPFNRLRSWPDGRRRPRRDRAALADRLSV